MSEAEGTTNTNSGTPKPAGSNLRGGRGRSGGGRAVRGRGRGSGRGRSGGRRRSHSEGAVSPAENASLGDGAPASGKEHNGETPENKNSNNETRGNRRGRGGSNNNGNSSNPRGGRGRGRGGRSGRGGRGGGRGGGRSPMHTNEREEQPVDANGEETPIDHVPLSSSPSENTNEPETALIENGTAISIEELNINVDNTNGASLSISKNGINTNSKSVLKLPPPPKTARKKNSTSKKDAPIMILHKTYHEDDDTYDSHAQYLSERLAEAALLEDEEQNKEESKDGHDTTHPPKTEKKKRKKKKKDVDIVEEAPPPPDPVSATDALQQLPAQEVSITADTQIKMVRNESSTSLSNTQKEPAKILPKNKLPSKKGSKALSNDAKSNQRAARKFNTLVRTCVDNSDPERLREILHDKANHKFALDAMTLETVMKAVVVAAMFEDALYCLRNCTLPATLTTQQTERILTCMPQNLRSSNAYAAADM
jgi:hypothetical protein